MEVRIGVKGAPRELVLDSNQSVDDIQVVQFVRVHYSDPNYAPEAQAQ